MPTDPTDSPEAVLLAALAARDAWQYERLVALCDPESVEQAFRGYCEVTRPRTLDDVRRGYPDEPEERLPALLQRIQQSMGDSEARLARSVPGVGSYAELTRLDAAEFLARHLKASDDRREFIERLRARGRPVPPSLLDTPPGLSYVALGHVAELPDLAHVLYRRVFVSGDAPPVRGAVELETARRQADGAWRLLVSRNALLRPGGEVAYIIDEEFADLFDDAPEGNA